MYIDEIKNKIENNINTLTKNYSPIIYSSKKVIHDSIHGTNSFEPFQPEVEKLAKENNVKVKIQYLDSVSLAEIYKQNKQIFHIF